MSSASWLSISSQIRPPQDIDLDQERYERGVELYAHAEDRIERAFDGSRWLKGKFPAGSMLQIDTRVSAVETIVVEKTKTKNYGGPKEITCRTLIPAAWFKSPDDGLLAIRILNAVLSVLRHVGDAYGLGGPPPLRSPGRDPQSPPLVNPFIPREMPAALNSPAVTAIENAMDKATPEQFVIAAHQQVPSAISANRERVIEALGAPHQQYAGDLGDGREVKVWLVQLSK